MSTEIVTRKLMPLAIPAGWAVVYNSFADEDAVIADGRIVNDEYYTEDLLSIEQVIPNSRGWSTRKSGYIFDLGWYPSSSPNGTYRLALLKGNWDNLILEFASKDRYAIRDILHLCFDLLWKRTDKDALKDAVFASYPSVTGP